MIFPLHFAEEPGVVDEMLLGGVDAGDDGMRMLRADFHVFQLFGARRQLFIDERGKAADSAVVNPHAGFHQSGGFFGGNQLALVFFTVILTYFYSLMSFPFESWNP